MSLISPSRVLTVLLALALSGCAAPSPAAPSQPTSGGQPVTDHSKSITIGISSTVPAMSIVTFGTPAGGWASLTEVHSDGLITSDSNSRAPIGRLAERVPSLSDGSISMAPDGRMKVVFTLRKGVTWQDGTPFTADDMVFSYHAGGPGGIPQYLNGALPFVSSVEATDPYTLTMYYKSPYYLGALLGPSMFWPLPQHLLGEAYDRFVATKNPEEVINSNYWTSGYVHLGPFRLTQFDPGNELTFRAYEGYHLGPPRVGAIHVRVFSDETTLYSNLVAGTVDLSADLALRDATGPQLKKTWDASQDGTVYAVEGALRRYEPQFRPGVQEEPTTFDPRVRTALMQALDREAISDGINGGNPQLAAWSILAHSDPLYSAAQDGLRVFSYDPDRARALLQEVGWAFGSDGSLRFGADGRPFKTAIYVSIGNENDAAASASYWRRVGLQVDEHAWTAAETRDNQARAMYPGWDSSGGNLLNPLGQSAATAENKWTGNRSGYEDATSQKLVQALKSTVDQSEQLQAMKQLNDFVVMQVPVIPMYYIATYVTARKGVRAFTPDDVAGFVSDSPLVYAYGTLSRNAYRWDLA